MILEDKYWQLYLIGLVFTQKSCIVLHNFEKLHVLANILPQPAKIFTRIYLWHFATLDMCLFHKWVPQELQLKRLYQERVNWVPAYMTKRSFWAFCPKFNSLITILDLLKLICYFKSLKSLPGVAETEVRWWLFLMQPDFPQGGNGWHWMTRRQWMTMGDNGWQWVTMDYNGWNWMTRRQWNKDRLENTFKEWPKEHLTSVVATFTFEHKMLTFLTFKNLESWQLKSAWQ